MQINEFLNNKKIIVVGSAPTIKNKCFGEYIDSFDVIVRMNGSYAINEYEVVDYGTRTDVVYLNKICGRKWKKTDIYNTGVKYIILKNNNAIQDNVITINKHIDKSLNMGVITILDLLFYKTIKSIDVTGFSFYADEKNTHINSHKFIVYELNKHNKNKNKKIFKDKIMSNSKVNVWNDVKKYL